MFALGDPTGPLFQASKLNPKRYANKNTVAMLLFQFLYYHEGDVRKALDLCEAVAEHKQKYTSWWWNTQRGRCHIALGKPRDADQYLRTSFGQFAHPDTALLLARIYIRVDQPLAALEVLDRALEKLPNDVGLLVQQGRIFELMSNLQASARMYRHIAQLEPINAEALACIAVHHFYNNQPEMALMYYRYSNYVHIYLNIRYKGSLICFFLKFLDEFCQWALTVVSCTAIWVYAVCMVVNSIWYYHVSNVPSD